MKMNTNKKRHLQKKWTPEEIALLKEHYPTSTTIVMQDLLKRSACSIYKKAHQLGVCKAEEFITQRTLNLVEAGKRYRYPKGNRPLNTGKKQTTYMSPEAIERTKATRFRKGHAPHNKKEIGHQRITQDGYLEVKVAEPNRFVLLHRWIWKIWNGPIPKGHRVHFKNGDKLNCDINNLELLTSQQAMEKNRISGYPVELQQVIRLNNKLTKKINSYGKK